MPLPDLHFQKPAVTEGGQRVDVGTGDVESPGIGLSRLVEMAERLGQAAVADRPAGLGGVDIPLESRDSPVPRGICGGFGGRFERLTGPSLVVGDQGLGQGGALQFGGAGGAEEPQGPIPEGPGGVEFTGTSKFGVGDVPGMAEGPFVGSAQRPAERRLDRGIPEPRVEGLFEVVDGGVDFAQYQVDSPQGIPAGSPAEIAERFGVMPDLFDHPVDLQPFRGRVVAGHHRAETNEFLDGGDAFEKSLSESGSPGRPPAMVQIEGAERHGEDHHTDRRGGRDRVPSGNFPGSVEQASPAGGDRFPREEAPKIFGDLKGRPVAAVAVDFQALEDDRLEVPGDGRIVVRGRCRSGRGVPLEDFGKASLEGGVAGQEPVERRPDAVNVRTGVDLIGLAADLLRGGEGRRSQDGAGPCNVAGVDFPGDAEVDDEGAPPAAGGQFDHDVGRLDVPMDEIEAVRRMEGVGDVGHDLGFFAQGQPVADLGQGAPGDVLHDDEGMSLDFADLEDRTDTFVVDPGLDPGLPDEALDDVGVVPAKELDGDGAAQPGIVGPVDVAHPAPADEVDQLVAIPVFDGEVVEGVGRCGASRGFGRRLPFEPGDGGRVEEARGDGNFQFLRRRRVVGKAPGREDRPFEGLGGDQPPPKGQRERPLGTAFRTGGGRGPGVGTGHRRGSLIGASPVVGDPSPMPFTAFSILRRSVHRVGRIGVERIIASAVVLRSSEV